ncbi:MAG: efflux RND transporter periplasmic adaptor subunit [Planctomycetota bacterium]|nr:efflux RND transporter periplasmic adaptor subunit [Planctomycetota bacterium]
MMNVGWDKEITARREWAGGRRGDLVPPYVNNPGYRFVASLLFVVWLALGSSGSPVLAAGLMITGFTEPLQQVDVASPEPGLVQTIDVREGDPVRSGQLLANLDNAVLEARLAVAKAKAESTAPVDAALAQYTLKKKRFVVIEQLHAQDNANVEELEHARSESAVAHAKLKAAETEQRLSALDAARIEAEIRHRQIRSPVDGVVLQLYRKPGEFLSSADPVLVTIANLDTLLVKFYVPTADAEGYAEGQTVDVRMSRNHRMAKAQIQFVSPVTDADSGTVRMDVVIQNNDRQFRSGVRCQLVSLASKLEAGGVERGARGMESKGDGEHGSMLSPDPRPSPLDPRP